MARIRSVGLPLIGLILAMILVGCGTENISTSTIPTESVAIDEMQKFPSYDWDAGDNLLLARVSANTYGTARDKQEAIIYILDQVWTNNISISEYIERNYEMHTFINEPDEYDYLLIKCVIDGIWVDDGNEELIDENDGNRS